MRGSIAEKLGIMSGDILLRINDEEIMDFVDYQALTATKKVAILVKRSGKEYYWEIYKEESDPLGITYHDEYSDHPYRCSNRCVFCFMDQMPASLRNTLYIKDDDWRMSLSMGSYITLTNMSDAEFKRVLRRRAGPLYISVHATDPDIRRCIMRNDRAGEIMLRLNQLKDAAIRFHCQIVLCPGLNDGSVLTKSLHELSSLFPSAQSLALVPVGLTRYRDNLEKLTPYTSDMAAELINQITPFQNEFLSTTGTRFVFAADEFYLLAGYPLPNDEAYEDYPQIENGVGLLKMLEEEIAAAHAINPSPCLVPGSRAIVCGVLVAPFIDYLVKKYAPSCGSIIVYPIINHFFGDSITVSGLITGGDLINQVRSLHVDEVLISASMLRSEGDLFLDGMSVTEARSLLFPVKLIVVPTNGEALYKALYGEEV